MFFSFVYDHKEMNVLYIHKYISSFVKTEAK